ncbi:MAG: lipoyl synthase [Deltaproteobacteria bacterium]|nr:lipoyl synthase [Deltaproteobacteria bacterium]
MTLSKSKPPWLRLKIPNSGSFSKVVSAIRENKLHTVCGEALCPNQMECFNKGTATFLLLGPSCTRRCTFCAVDKSAVQPPDLDEPARTAEAVARLKLTFCVLTMVTRDDLSDGGAAQVARTVAAIRRNCPGVGIELLISDLDGNWKALGTVLAALPEVLNHNIETVSGLYPRVRPQADYQRSLKLLSIASENVPPIVTKSGMMLGLGEKKEEVLRVMDDLRKAGCHILTLGQYLAPSKQHHAVARYIHPEEFAEFETEALARGFSGVASAPLVRSSYQAEQLFRIARSRLFCR